MTFMQQNLSEFISFLRKQKIRRMYFVFDEKSQQVKSSHPELDEIGQFLSNDQRDYDKHEAAFLELHPRYDVLMSGFVHRTRRGQGAGGTRFWRYDTMEDFFRDGLRLSRGMSRKNALSGLWWGGGKGVISLGNNFDPDDTSVRQDIFQRYGKFITSLKGCYVTAEDVGTTTKDVGHIFACTRFVTCIPSEVGGSGNPSPHTAKGVVVGMQAALAFSGLGNLSGKTVAIQGLGNVARPLVQYLIENDVAQVMGVDISVANIQACHNEFSSDKIKLRQVALDDHSILFEHCDILAPCATGGILNNKTIPQLNCKIVCGGANNQLEDENRDGLGLKERGIVYVPDYLANRMGIVHCANEQYGYVNKDPMIERHYNPEWGHSIYKTTLTVLNKARDENKPTNQIADEVADALCDELHPIMGYRVHEVIWDIVNSNWAERQ